MAIIFVTKGKTNWKYLAIVFILGVIVGAGTLWLTSKQGMLPVEFLEIKKPEKVVEEETANWKTYRNEKYGFEFKYPREFAEDERCKAVEMENVIGIGMSIFITIKDSGGLSLSEYVDKEITFEVESRKNITVGGKEAISIEYRFGGMGRYGKVVYLLSDDKIFVFSFTAGGECPSTDISELVVFDGILSTFRFLE